MSLIQCKACGEMHDADRTCAKPAIAAGPGSEFSVGASVTWTHCRSNGRSIQFTTRHGRILELGKSIALCKQHRSGRTEWVRYDRLRIEGVRTELTDLVTSMASPLSPNTNPSDAP